MTAAGSITPYRTHQLRPWPSNSAGRRVDALIWFRCLAQATYAAAARPVDLLAHVFPFASGLFVPPAPSRESSESMFSRQKQPPIKSLVAQGTKIEGNVHLPGACRIDR